MTFRTGTTVFKAGGLGVVAVLAALSLGACGDSSGDATGTAVPKPAKDAALSAQLPDAIRDSGVVRVATDVPFPPFEMFTGEGETQIAGLDYDLGQALAGKLGVRFDFRQQRFDGLIPALQAGKYDVIMSAMTSNAERRQVLDFVDYFRSGTGIMVRSGNPDGIRTMLDLCGRTAAVQSGAQQIDFVKSEQRACAAGGRPPIKVMSLPKFSDAQLALTSRKADAMVADKPVAAYTAKTAGNGSTFEVVDDPAARGGYNAQPGGIGVLKGNTELVKAFRAALQRLIDEGVYGRILDRYGIGSIAIEQATVNSDG